MDYPELEVELDTEILGSVNETQEKILTLEALEFASLLHLKFNPKRLELLNYRKLRQAEIDSGTMPYFLPETESIREGDWKTATIPDDLLDRRVEITGPVDRKMIINALNSGVKVFMADFEDSNSPTWENIINGQINLRDAINKSISFTNPNGKHYELNWLDDKGWTSDKDGKALTKGTLESDNQEPTRTGDMAILFDDLTTSVNTAPSD